MSDGLTHVLWLMLVISAVAIVTKYIRLPYTIALVLTGLAIALLPDEMTAGLSMPLTSDLILFIFLPALLFEGAYNLDFSRLRDDIRTVTVLAVFGVLLTMGLVGLAVHYMLGLDWAVAFLFGAIVAATDPIAVLATFRQLGATNRLSTIVEGESLFNDGTSLVAFSIILGMLGSGKFNLALGIGQFALLTIGGLAVGSLLGLVCSLLLTRIDDHLVETVITLLLAYGTYLISEGLHVSGVIAVVAAGLVVGNFGQAHGMSPSTRVAVNYTWDLLGFVANSLIFILIGLQLDIGVLGRYLVPVIVAAVGTLLARALVIGGLNWLLLKRIGQSLPGRWLVLITWGGLRGALALAMVLSIPLTLVGNGMHEQLLNMTFGVILFSLLGQGLTIRPLLRWLGLAAEVSEQQLDYERTYGLLQSAMAARRQLQRMVEQGQVSREVTAQLVEEYDAREQELRLKVHLLQTINQDLLAQEQLTARRQLLQVEKNTLRALLTRGAISTAVQRELISELDRQLQEISEPQFEADGTSTGETNEVEVEQRRRTELDDALR
jgi:monovalent cation:H+ antiporter, CPA1 family